jgi:hypothetical protein
MTSQVVHHPFSSSTRDPSLIGHLFMIGSLMSVIVPTVTRWELLLVLYAVNRCA